ncbi:cell filamentation protein Fic [Mesorhizobium sp. Root102]|uniref:Fic family protein n=1 Tax=Mesorhizobium sp. Root102 TaxID=1736422 RepID=UPI000701F868|nr:Fic family protein [Mesorhizobium sp. Root102]KQU95523.1 cell filamentation protein Fic [Mesorhizobium sp. Root102]
MAKPHEKLAQSLAILKDLQEGGRRIFKSDEIRRVHRERLLQNGFLRDIIRGWVMSTSPQAQEHDTTPWYASFWEFCSLYCNDRFGKDWFLSPEQSLLLHAEATAILPQVVVNTPNGTNNKIDLLFATSLYDLKVKGMPEELTKKNGLRVFTMEAALIRVPEGFFQRAPIDVQVAIASLRNVSGVLGLLLDGGHSAVAGRLAGAFRRLGREAFADEIIAAFKSANYDVRETDPFAGQTGVTAIAAGVPPLVARLRAIWQSQRAAVIEIFPKAPGLPSDKQAYMKFVEDIYESDAYHSLSIEGYSVTPELIDRVRGGDWNPQINEEDRKNRDALAARGYYLAFQKVKDSVAAIVEGAPAGALTRDTHSEWYRELFAPSVTAGILKASALAGYRNHPVYLRGSQHVPPRSETVADGMNALFDLLQAESEPSVRAVLGHWLVGYVHPYPDGNGRMARFLMNTMLASGGYHWTIVRVDDRKAYLAGLEDASVNMDVRPFAAFLAQRVKWSSGQAK